MQLSQVFRRGITVPLDNQAEAEARAWQVSDASRFQVISINAEADFYAIWCTGIFSALNRVCGSHIDDYEEELLEPHVLDEAINILSSDFNSLPTDMLRRFRDDLIRLFEEARDKNRPVIFIF